MAEITSPIPQPQVATPARTKVRQWLSTEDWLLRGLTALIGLWLVVSVLLPMFEMLWRSLLDQDGNFVGLANYVNYFSSPALSESLFNSVYVAATSMIVTVVLAFIFAYALTRTAMPGKNIFRLLAMLPLFAPSLLHAIAFIYLFGNKGLLTTGFFGAVPININIDLYNAPTGIILAEIFYLFPHALLILTIALSLADARMYEAATALGATPFKTFLTVTLPGAKYGIISAAIVCFTLVITDFGIPKVVGGNYDVLATDIYKQVVGQQNFVMGATVSIVLLAPTAIGFIIDRVAQRQQFALLSSRIVPYQPKPNPTVDQVMLIFCSIIGFLILVVLGTAIFASLIKVWPYNFELGFRHYDFSKVAGNGLKAYTNSLQMAGLTALFGTITVFITAYLIEKGKDLSKTRAGMYFLATIPAAVPGLVLGLSYIFFFNRPQNPLNFLYGTMGILVLSTIVHFFTVSFYTAMAALKQIDKEFEAVSASLNVPFYKTLWRVTVPVSLPAILEIAMYYFVNAMTTVSAVIFLYAANLRLAAVTIVNMDDAGDTAPAAAMSMVIFFTGVGVRLLYEVITYGIRQRTQAWRKR